MVGHSKEEKKGNKPFGIDENKKFSVVITYLIKKTVIIIFQGAHIGAADARYPSEQ